MAWGRRPGSRSRSVPASCRRIRHRQDHAAGDPDAVIPPGPVPLINGVPAWGAKRDQLTGRISMTAEDAHVFATTIYETYSVARASLHATRLDFLFPEPAGSLPCRMASTRSSVPAQRPRGRRRASPSAMAHALRPPLPPRDRRGLRTPRRRHRGTACHGNAHPVCRPRYHAPAQRARPGRPRPRQRKIRRMRTRRQRRNARGRCTLPAYQWASGRSEQ